MKARHSSRVQNSPARGRIFSLNYKRSKESARTILKEARLLEDFGLEGDERAGKGSRQVSLLSIESIKRLTDCPKAKKRGPFNPGDFSENITTEGLDLSRLRPGDELKLGSQAVLEITGIGKECYKYCAVYRNRGGCTIPHEGAFARVLKGGEVAAGDGIEAVKAKIFIDYFKKKT